MSRGRVVPWLTTVVLCLLASATSGQPSYRRVELDLGTGVEIVRWGRRGSSGKIGASREMGFDLFAQAGRSVRVWIQDERGLPERPTRTINLEASSAFVDFGNLTGSGNAEVVIVTTRGVSVAGPDGSLKKITGLPRLPPGGGRIPRPIDPVRVDLLEDLNGDGLDELVVPVRGGFVLFQRASASAPLAEKVFLECKEKVKIDVGGPGVLQPLTLDFRLPKLRFKDLNGDGLTDVVAERRNDLNAYLQTADGFPTEPSYRLDLGPFRKEAEKGAKRGRTEIDIPGTAGVRVREEDVDGDGVEDYLVAAGQLLRVYFGSKAGADFSRPHIVLKFSSTLRGVGSFDFDNDGRRDLVALKFEVPNLPQFIAAYFVAMSIDFEVLGYRNEGGRRFSRRPSRRNTLTLSFPPLRKIVEGFEGFAERFLGRADMIRRYAEGDVNADGIPDAAFLDDDDTLRVFYNSGPLPKPTLGQLLFDTKKQRWELQELLDHVASTSFSALRSGLGSRKADLEIPVGSGYSEGHLSLEVLDINGDGRGDLAIRWNQRRLRLYLSS